MEELFHDGETYIPKLNRGWGRLPSPLTLKSLCLRQVVNNLSIINQPLPATERVQLRDHLHTNLLPWFFDEMVEMGHQALLKPQNLLNLLFALPPSSFEAAVDLNGFYDGTECCKRDSSSNWIYGFIPDICVNVTTCKKLFILLTETIDLSKLKTLTLWAQDRAFKAACLPYIFPKARNLTRLVIRGDADDHILSIIGSHCHFLKILDISRSRRVTALGLFNLIFKNYKTTRTELPALEELLLQEKRLIASSLDSLTLTRSCVEIENLQTVANLLNYAYLSSKLPEVTYQRPKTFLATRNLIWDREILSRETLVKTFEQWLTRDRWLEIQEIFRISLRQFGNCQLDIYLDLPGRSTPSLNVYAHRMNELLLHGYYNVSPTLGLTELELYWDMFNWDMDDLLEFTDLISQAPNLKRIDCRICGTWEGPTPILVRLTEIHCWTLSDATVISILKACPSLQIVDIKNVRVLEEEGNNVLTHDMLLYLMTTNPTLWPCIREFIIRPTNLTKESVIKLTQMCPQLKRVGDLECWDVTAEEIKDLNNALYHSQSQCVLVVLSFPPTRS